MNITIVAFGCKDELNDACSGDEFRYTLKGFAEFIFTDFHTGEKFNAKVEEIYTIVPQGSKRFEDVTSDHFCGGEVTVRPNGDAIWKRLDMGPIMHRLQ